MKRTQKVMETREAEKVVEWTCDVCGEPEKEWTSEVQFKAVDLERYGYNHSAYSEVNLDMSGSYPEYGIGKKWEVDICPRCFVTKLIPWIESHRGVKIEPIETDWP